MAESTELVANQPDVGNKDGSAGSEEQKSGFLSGLGNFDALRQIIIVVALAICVAIAIFIMLWVQEPEYRPLGEFETRELVETLDFLDANNHNYRVQGNVVSVRASDFSAIRLQMTRQGMGPAHRSMGDDFIMQDPGFGVSQRLEAERLKYSREQQLSRTIEQMQSIDKARVLLALPRENVFARRERQPSASVMVNTRRPQLNREEIDSIVDLVASAVPQLTPGQVTVTDQNGKLLHSGSRNELSAQARREYEIERQREQEYLDKIDNILSPILGYGNYTSQVDVTMDFTQVEQTQRTFNPDLPAIRSEMIIEDNTVGGGIGGIPGALSNQPPLESDIPEQVGASMAAPVPGRNHREQTRNFELDQTISFTRQQSGVLQRLSVSVALDYRRAAGEGGEEVQTPFTDAELANIRRMLMAGLGYNVNRGDTVEVVAFPFIRQPLFDADGMPWWEAPWFWRLMRLLAGVLVITVLIVTVVRPMLRKLIYPDESADDGIDELLARDEDLGDETIDMLTEQFDSDSIGFSPDGTLQLPDLHKDEDLLKAVRALVANEPELSSQVVKAWLNEDV
ncbi:flagellar basal-body MS-ring/collar protein FliF [Aliidiomarina maris]|uniref:Flagellar M-ring protein n=1 Tax=Aliidiomarina maris TaxID=531312 RepID=A0A327WQI2_9GAMM|nr:flagellar basal-body MS-ring/collar protein FliF [Aliidiomarina maris]RAJ94618.1 flagellar M-ring protein FliF [Aliidiomarina maris]RUO19721.1 flagellar basal body M-ring protein FliF [Aliidiomarina maris]